MQAILFPTTHNSDYRFGLASHIWMGDGLEAPGLPIFGIRCMCLTQLDVLAAVVRPASVAPNSCAR